MTCIQEIYITEGTESLRLGTVSALITNYHNINNTNNKNNIIVLIIIC